MVDIFRIILDYFFVICIVTGSMMTGGSKNADLKIINDNIVNGLINGTFSPFSGSDINDADTIISKIVYDEDGNCYFSDVDYGCTDRSNWVTRRHLNRCCRLAILYRQEKDTTKKNNYKEYVLKLLDHWSKHDYQNSNWWHNKLAAPNTLGEIALLMKDDLSFKQKIVIGELIGRGCFSVNTSMKTHAAANIIDIAMSSIKYGVFADSPSVVKTAVKLVGNELEYSDYEGLRTDATFFQHGERLYMGGYGLTFVNGMENLMEMLTGTELNFKSQQLEKLADFIVDGLQVMSYGNTLDPTTMGRSVSRLNSQPLKGLSGTLRKLAAISEMPRKQEILAYADSIDGNTQADTGVHYFDVAQFLVINNSDFYFSFRGGEKYLAYSEIINDENILGYNSSFPGVTTIMHTGNETRNISPVYNYCRVPGTTAADETDEELKAHEDFTYRYLDGNYGYATAKGAAVSFAQTEHEGMKMTVACFATDKAAFLLGTGFTDSKGRQLTTTVDQCFLNGSVQKDGSTVIHNGIKYSLIEGGNFEYTKEHVIGNWRRNNLSYGTDSVEGDVFTLSFKNNGSYAYSVMSEKTNETIKVIENNESVQAVMMSDGRIAAVFYTDGVVSYKGTTINGKAGKAYIVERVIDN